jgi:hypothetical protein
MAKYRTAHGKMIDIEKLRLTNEKTIAVGNMKVNARGDQLGQGGKVIATRNEVMNQQYKIHGTIVSDNVPQTQVENTAPDGESFDPPGFEETVKPVEPKLRGTLADSIAKSATVEQKPLDKDMHKNNGNKGPQRI